MELITGNYYVYDSGSSNYLFKFNGFAANGNTTASYYLHIADNSFSGPSSNFSSNKDIREATQQEINHLEACNKAGTYVPSPKEQHYEIY